MNYKLKDFNRNIPDVDLLADLRRVADQLGTNKLSSRDYDAKGGKYSSGTIGVRFGSWNNALEKAKLNLVRQRDVSKEELFLNLERVWINIGRQPVFRDMKSTISKYSTYQYVVKFGTWTNGLRAFVEYINSGNGKTLENETEDAPLIILKNETVFKHKTKRFPNERLKVRVLMRDGNKCRLCGITLTGDNIHFDHIIPWKKGGETVLENLQILCAPHNLAKGDLA